MKEHSFYVDTHRHLLGDAVLGVQGEHKSDVLVLSLPRMWGEIDLSRALITLAFHNPADYFEELSPDGIEVGENITLRFPLTRNMTAVAGKVKLQLIARHSTDTVFKSEFFEGAILDSAISPEEISSPYPEELSYLQTQIDTKADRTQVNQALSLLEENKADKNLVAEDIESLGEEMSAALEALNADKASNQALLKKADRVNTPVGTIAGLTPDGNLCDSTLSLEDLGGGVFRLTHGGESVITFQSRPLDVNNWADVQTIVRSGQARAYFKVGDQLVCEKGGEKLVWDIIGIDEDTPSDETLSHSLTLMLHDVWRMFHADATQALYVSDIQREAGMFYFYKDELLYYFTTTQTMPAGAQITISQDYTKANVFRDNTLSSLIETCSVTVTSENTVLWDILEGTATALNPRNEFAYAYGGSCDYLASPLRLWLNSSKEDWWEPATQYSRRHYLADSVPGFLKDMDEDFLAVVGKVKKTTRVPTTLPNGELTDTDERFFILSATESGAGTYPDEGETYSYFTDDASRQKSLDGTAVRWRLRTARLDKGYSYCDINTDGKLNHAIANGSDGVVPVCCIV